MKIGEYRAAIGLRGNNYLKNPGIACEVEVEYPQGYVPAFHIYFRGDPSDRMHHTNWNMTVDGSLRNNGVEYVNRKPKNIKVILSQLKLLLDDINKNNLADPEATRAGYHVHCNVQHMTLMEMLTSIMAIWLMESTVSFFTGKLREGNLFCVRQVDASHQIRRLAAIMGNPNQHFVQQLSHDNFKYGSLNIGTVFKFGSLEHRMMKGLVREPERLLSWTKYCNDVTYNHGFESPSDVLDTFFDVNKNGDILNDLVLPLLQDNLYMREAVVKHYEDRKNDLRELMFESAINLLHLGYLRSNTQNWETHLKTFEDAPQREEPGLLRVNVAPAFIDEDN